MFVLECKTRFIGTLGSNKVLSEVWRLFQYRDDMQTYKSYIPILFSWQVPISFPELALTFKTCILKTHSAWKIAYMSTRSPASVCKQYFLPLQMLSTYYWAYAKKILHATNWSALDNCVEESCVKYTDFLCQCRPWNSQPAILLPETSEARVWPRIRQVNINKENQTKNRKFLGSAV